VTQRTLRILVLALCCGLAALVVQPRASLTASLGPEVEMADMTWVQVRTAVAAGYDTVIVPSGGIEQNGAHMVLGKHDYIVRHNALAIAAGLGRTLVAPVVSYVPEGDYAPPSGNMAFPGTVGVTEAAFEATLDGIARSLRRAGFKTICFIADHGQSLAPQARVAERLTIEWKDTGTRVLAVDRYYADEPQQRWLLAQGESAETIGSHAGLQDTSELMAAHPAGVDLSRLPTGGFLTEPTGGSGDVRRASAERGEALLRLKIDAAIGQIQAARAP
jgi:creatinine amidohydrolase